jgi:FkbM family methyltransferase
LNYENNRFSGERCFLKAISPKIRTVFDVGANEGDYSKTIKYLNPQTDVFAFEPHPQTYSRLRESGRIHSFQTFNFGLGKENKSVKLFDYKGSSGSSHATLYRNVIEQLHRQEATTYDIEVRTIDDVADELSLSGIDLLKIDTEGHEYDVLLGVSKLLASDDIKIIHFEFNEMNVFSRTYLRDFMQILKNFTFFRMIQDGIVPLTRYYPNLYEIFAYQNIVAILKDEVANYNC